MKVRALEALLWIVTAVAAVAAVLGTVRARPTAGSVAVTVDTPAAPPDPMRQDAAALAEASTTIIASDPFRFERRPARVLYGAEPDPPLDPQPASPSKPRPVLSVSGIIGGPPWEAILDGVPGRDGGLLVRPGQRFGELRVRTIGPDTVIVVGADTVWILTLRRPWP